MALIKNKWTKPEILMHNYLKGNKIKHKMHPNILGSPDIIIKKNRIAIFLHGCFWHGCKRCRKIPQTNKKFWKNKIDYNIKMGARNIRLLRKHGFKTMVIWEHELPVYANKRKMKNTMKSILIKITGIRDIKQNTYKQY